MLHSFCQWQAVYQAVGWLNCCLRCPFPEKNIGRLYSGRFIYNLSVELLDSTSLSGKLNELMPSDSPLRDLYHEKLKPIRDAVGPEVIDSLMSPPARKSFKQKRRLAANFNLVDKVS